MKHSIDSSFSARKTCVLAAAVIAGLTAQSASAATFYWDSTVPANTAGFGNAQGTWTSQSNTSTTGRWVTSSTGSVSGSITQTTASSDVFNFGSATDGLGTGTITIGATVAMGNTAFSSLSGVITLTGGQIDYGAGKTITVNNALNNINSPLGGTNGFTKAGTGILVLGGNSSYTGATIINNGTLRVNGSLAAGSAVTVNGGTLGGTGTINGTVNVNAATVAPGASAGTLTINNTLTLGSVSILGFELNAADQTVGGGINDLITGVNDLTLDGTLNVTSAALSAGTWRLINYSGTLNDQTLSLGSINLAPLHTAGIDTSVTGQVNLVVTAIPEPATLGLLAMGGFSLLRRKRR